MPGMDSSSRTKTARPLSQAVRGGTATCAALVLSVLGLASTNHPAGNVPSSHSSSRSVLQHGTHAQRRTGSAQQQDL